MLPKINLDKYDKAILSLLVKFLDKYLPTNQIAKRMNISTLTAKRHLLKLEKAYYVDSKVEGYRKYKKKKIKVPRKILWILRYK